MPYADKEKQRAAQREAMRRKRATDSAYRVRENEKRNAVLKADKEANKAAVARWREAHPTEAKEQTRKAVSKHRKKSGG